MKRREDAPSFGGRAKNKEERLCISVSVSWLLLPAADAGIAIKGGAAIAREIADITFAGEDLYELVTLRQIAVQLQKRIARNYRFVLGFNGGLIALGALGILAPATSALLHNASTLGVTVHSLTNLLPSEHRAQRA